MEDVTGVFVAALAAAVPLAVLVTKATDLIRNLVGDNGANTSLRWVWNVVPLALGVGLCLGWGYNVAAALAHTIPALAENSRLDGVLGQVLTGLAIGGMAGFWHEKLDQWSSAAKVNKTAAGSPQ